MTVIVVIEPDKQRLQGMLQLLASKEPAFVLKGADYSKLYKQEPASIINPDLALLCVHTYEDVFELTHATQQVYAPKHVLMLSSTTSVPHSLPRLGAILAGYIDDQAPQDQLLASIRLVLAGGNCFPLLPPTLIDDGRSKDHPMPSTPRLAARTARDQHHQDDVEDNQQGEVEGGAPAEVDVNVAKTEAKMLRITPRQYQVLVLLGRGYPIKTISRHLNISISTAKAHRETLYQRLDVNNRSEAVYTALARGATLGWDQNEPAAADTPKS